MLKKIIGYLKRIVKGGITLDTSKLILEVDSDKFHDTYVHFLRKLYDDQFIRNYHFTVDDPVSFRRTFANKAGIKDIAQRTEHTVFTKEEMDTIVEDTNNKYEECATGKYTKSIAERQMRRYRVMSRVLKETLTELGFKEAADKLLYTDELEEEPQPIFVPPQEAQDKKLETLEKAKHAQNILTLNKHTEAFKAFVKNANKHLSILEGLETLGKEIKEELLQAQKEFQDNIDRTYEYLDKFKEYPEAEEFKKLVETTAADFLERFKKLQNIPMKPEQESIQDIQKKEEVISPEETYAAAEDHQLSLNNSVATLIPLMTEELKKFLCHCATKISEDEKTIAKLTEHIADLYSTIKVGNETIERFISAQPALPEDEEELYLLVQQGMEKISDKSKIKELVMSGMKKI